MIVRAALELRSYKKFIVWLAKSWTRTTQYWKAHFQPALLKPKSYPEGLAELVGLAAEKCA